MPDKITLFSECVVVRCPRSWPDRKMEDSAEEIQFAWDKAISAFTNLIIEIDEDLSVMDTTL